jgi:hypothetical protein
MVTKGISYCNRYRVVVSRGTLRNDTPACEGGNLESVLGCRVIGDVPSRDNQLMPLGMVNIKIKSRVVAEPLSTLMNRVVILPHGVSM